jgi:hypothetical protein
LNIWIADICIVATLYKSKEDFDLFEKKMNDIYKITFQKLNNYKNHFSLRRIVLLQNFAKHLLVNPINLTLKDDLKELT